MTRIIDGKQQANRLREVIGQETLGLQERHGIRPGLAVVMVGNDPASQVYVRNKARQAGEAGIASFEHRLEANVSQQALLALIATLNADPAVHGILVQLPLPASLSEAAVIQAIAPDKDVDGFHPINIGNLATGARAMVPCTPLGCLMLLRQQLGELAGKRALVLGRSNIVGKPMANLLLRDSCTVTVAHSRTHGLAEECRRADILVAAVGRPGLVTGDWIKPGATIIDVGINRIEEQGRSRLAGDVDFTSASQVAGAITPVPGGVGPMTIACLLLNTLQATCHQHRLPFAEDIPQRALPTHRKPTRSVTS
ncbi:bifunctional methylenetetrahydrofolate dehydrogenase/methenyltetrahydrofolate cyclohydrolase FolD [Halomonas urumqiensis]|uniref:Bifunctional protein FolD n=1 Tax=Halomonas urumqiensis TaxID=1684789 RepID=A0A2N7UCB4_9GAMM|nr:bifunctional methylenetetrahydrofolate dehydrogenase/methenyltetrahydrofolate cyclohydrolase FolD [Halomonas urumqiensis]PMR78045.1 bifunctional methylenetetrahydrofolate dehydrogenase/methenyltetrahydrofolate cyclohydrolase FolD [Halomonas urumqiensis]PTB03196.1 bifunctional methylenetetrahydrofolate dehydrogenase/methenyltetrahydrofolate cyclohydrolase FolD [Halomonas urumqiensis]GHE20656.1 bifunctional protein FolD [Halomonas urumqiensis]